MKRKFSQFGYDARSELTSATLGNAELVWTGTGIWVVSYDAKNRPASFRDVSTGTLVECAYDCRGRTSEARSRGVPQVARIVTSVRSSVGSFPSLNALSSRMMAALTSFAGSACDALSTASSRAAPNSSPRAFSVSVSPSV